MRTILSFLTITIITLITITISTAHAQPPEHAGKDNHGYFVRGQILVKPRAGVADQVLQNIFSHENGIQKNTINKINIRIVRVPDGKEQKIIDRLNKNPNIEFAELDRLIEPSLIPDDPYFLSSWHHTTIGSSAAWDITQGDPNLIIAILDSGIDMAHPDLAAHLVPGWNHYNNNSDTTDISGHGTKVAGAAAAIGNNAIGVSGVAANVKIMPIRITDAAGWGVWSSITNGIIWAADHGARIGNLSYDSSRSSAIITAAQYFKDKGGVFFVASGNDGTFYDTPDYSTMIVVSATGSNDVKASWASYGPRVDIAAPGVGIYTTINGGSYGGVSGTSMSSPVAAGVGALIVSTNPALMPNDIETILKASAVDLGAEGVDDLYGHGRVDAAAAVIMAQNYTPPIQDTISPTVGIDSPTSGLTVSGTVIVNVTANDNIGVIKTDLHVNGTLYATDTTFPYSFSWDTSPLGNADVTLTVRAFDAAGNETLSSGVPVLVRNIIDTTPPVVTISTPANGATISGRNTTINASATDNLDVVSMKLFIDNHLEASTSGNSLSYNWNLKKVSDGTHSIMVEATDASNNKASHLIEVTKGGDTSGGGGGGKGGGRPNK